MNSMSYPRLLRRNYSLLREEVVMEDKIMALILLKKVTSGVTNLIKIIKIRLQLKHKMLVVVLSNNKIKASKDKMKSIKFNSKRTK
jgi:hypothetical protein